MSTLSAPPHPWPPSCVLFTLLPGPDRKRTDSTYCYRLTYRSADDTAAGCVMTWEVSGGRLVYQIAVERDLKGDLHLHCTCADAVFRAEEEGRYCKHVRGLLAFGAPAPGMMPVPREPATLRLWSAAEDIPTRISPPESRLGEVA
ncbi:MAG TPA: hypothetical protein VNK04_07875 [Gemmataceae bacterium]|nr:hypothetical protein [Gemmataceae bacterium]